MRARPSVLPFADTRATLIRPASRKNPNSATVTRNPPETWRAGPAVRRRAR